MSETDSPSRRGRLLRSMAALVVLLAVGAYLAVQYLTGGGDNGQCTVRAADASSDDAPGDTYQLTPEQAGNAATISAVGITKGMPERAVTIALATALQESGLRNLGHGDRDSLGLFQQRPSKGWGTEQQILDPVYAASQFYDHLAEVPGYSRLPLTVAAQRVQHSAYPQAYAKHEPDATLLAAAFTGQAPAVLTCPAPTGNAPGDPEKVREALVRSFGPKVLPSGPDAAGTDSTGAVSLTGTHPARGADPASSGGAKAAQANSPSAAVVSVPVESLPGAGGGERGEMAGADMTRRGWELAHWAVAQAAALRIDEVTYDGRVWNADAAGEGWQHTSAGATKADAAEVDIHIAQ